MTQPDKAMVDRVIDGDTLLLRMDLGFQVWKEQRVRLAEIDCPAMDEPGGEAAYRYVRDQLAKVFAQGNYLNQELLDEGLA